MQMLVNSWVVYKIFTQFFDVFDLQLDIKVESRIKSEANSIEERNNGISEAASSSVLNKVEDGSEPDSFPSNTSHESSFVLPDLNMVPDEDTVGWIELKKRSF